MRIGYKASAEQFSPGELTAYAIRAEELGLDSVTVSDHFQPWRLSGGHAPNSLTWLAFVAARTERVLLGTSVLTPTFRYNPAVLAQAFATLACLAPERIFLGVGSGEALNEMAVGSVPDGQWPEFKERFARLRESVELMRKLWTDESVTFDGTYYRTVDARIFDRPDRPVPIYVAAGGPMVARYAGRVGDGFICTSGKGRELYADQLVPAVAEGRAKGDRSGQPIDRMIEIKLSWDPDPDLALENTRFWAPLSLTAEQKHTIDSPAEMEHVADRLPLEQVAKRWIVASRPEDVVDAVRFYTDLGFDHLVLHGPGADQGRFLTTLADEVVPGLRELVPAPLEAVA
ncbi:glucose-6-phosphate dehydrogenase (coenzyme-F420) [Knoellia aerolata]|uniref:Glucose-6-phosphate dehydrogenase n=1 Tax=Knoellia aerolata DSM 18566 TaxID=1385519 RepID=A0A0A0JX27_9MICO|nr:glucose-6-phosphate dehydrogenase (coenzyme-F420) [Knoellia aerolata]KGN41980.1 glucose-6-phosphate dehydrogenase [Knoellia aerolata DSM 18566]